MKTRKQARINSTKRMGVPIQKESSKYALCFLEAGHMIGQYLVVTSLLQHIEKYFVKLS